MAIDDKIKNLNKQLYPTGRVWRINPNSIKEKFVNGLLASEIRAYNDGVSILDSTIPDNPNFTVDDASAWEKRLGLPDGTGVALEDRIKAIVVQLNWPGTNPAKGAADYIEDVLRAAGFNVCVHENLFQSIGTIWTSQTAPNNSWRAIAFGNGIFVTVGSSGAVATTTDGITWIPQTAASASTWWSVCFGNNLFVAVAANDVMTSPDGITWTSRTSAANNTWFSVTYGGGLFVAVSLDGSGNRVMTSPDGITWTSRTSAANNTWSSVTYGGGLFVAVSTTGSGNRVMTSPDGITWTSRTSAANNTWISVTYGNSIFVAVSENGYPNNVMTSPDGITWTARTGVNNNSWERICFGADLFVSVALSGSGNRIMTSPDGITWTSQASPSNSGWHGIAFGNTKFVAIAQDSYPNNAMINSTTYYYKTYADFAGIGLVRHKTTLLHGQQRHGNLSSSGIIVANSVDPSVDDNFDLGDYSDTIFIGGCPPGTFINIPKAQETAFRQFILKIKPVNITVLLLVHFV